MSQRGSMIVPPRIYLQDVCLKHKFVRNKDASDVYERPERIRAINIGISALHARLETINHIGTSTAAPQQAGSGIVPVPLTIVRSAATLDMRAHKGALAVHGGEDEDGNQWCLADDIDEWCVRSLLQIQQNKSEIPEKYEQDLYLCPESLQAFEGALGTVCEAVDHVCKATGVFKGDPSPPQTQPDVGTPSPRVFVAVRPPGHHCGEDTPAGFGFVNNVCVGAFHAFEQHRLGRIVIFDIDLHHGNGTQEIVRTYQAPKIFYGSTHDIESYPCEDKNRELIDDASLQLHGINGEWIHNVHLLRYKTEADFWTHYEHRYRSLFRKATEFIETTGGAGDDVIVFMSCGFDASEYETTEMSRHGRHVPTSFYHRFTLEACAFANKYAGGRLVSVLEGGYSDRALTSGVMSHIAGLAEAGGQKVSRDWWGNDELNKIEKVTKKRRGRPTKLDHLDWWLRRMQQIFEGVNRDAAPATPPKLTQLYVPPPPPPYHNEPPKAATALKKPRASRTKRPLPPPTSIVTRRAKRASPDETGAGAQPGRKRRRLSTQEPEEEEESSAEEMRVGSAKPKVRFVPPCPHTRLYSGDSHAGKQPAMGVRGQGDVNQGRMPQTSTGLPTPQPSSENIAKPLATCQTGSAAPKPPPTPNLARIRNLAVTLQAELPPTNAATATMPSTSQRFVSGAHPVASSSRPTGAKVDKALLSAEGSLRELHQTTLGTGQKVILTQLEELYTRLDGLTKTLKKLKEVADLLNPNEQQR